jgi:hypothetical protein
MTSIYSGGVVLGNSTIVALIMKSKNLTTWTHIADEWINKELGRNRTRWEKLNSHLRRCICTKFGACAKMVFISAYTFVHKETEKRFQSCSSLSKSLQAGGIVDWIHLIPLPQLRGMHSMHTSGGEGGVYRFISTSLLPLLLPAFLFVSCEQRGRWLYFRRF